ncbi:MAG: AraC family transcriptional regulator [Rhodospirillaceae bacterium]|nr:AraC family transcriptional regulator [Rhodospirillaceae bacterium]
MVEKTPIQQQIVQQQMTAQVLRLAPTQGMTQTALESVRLMRSNQPWPRHPVLYEPSICIVCQGRKRGFLGDQVFVYDPQQYLVLSVPLPFEGETEASAEEPFLGVSLRIDLTVAAELVLALDEAGGPAVPAPAGICATPLDAPLADAVLRLLQALASPLEARLIGPSILREIYFRVLTGEQGGAIRAALTHQSQFGKVAKALRRIHAEIDADIDVGSLAREAGMSVPAFHAHFKAVTQTSPIQYVKATRLHRARLLMVQEGASAAHAASRVGYESASQFSREFKRFFGRTPQEEAAAMRSILVNSPALATPMLGDRRYVAAT